MLRKLALSIFALMLPLAVSAAVPGDVNLHNGYIIVVNHVHYTGAKTVDFLVHFHSGINSNQRTLAKDGYVTFNQCCIVAGQKYLIAISTHENFAGVNPNVEVHARLCNIRGIPFGYSEVELTGDVRYVQSDQHPALGAFEVKNIAVRQADTGCP